MLDNYRFVVKDMNWIANDNIDEVEAQVKTRYRQEPINAKITRMDNNMAEISLMEPLKAVTPGQACVIYSGNRLLGGGWITREIF